MRFREGCRFALVALGLAAIVAAPAQAARQERFSVKPFSGAKVVKRSASDLEAYWIPLGKLFGDGQAEKFQVVEGKWTHVTYSNPAKSSVIEIARYYDQQLQDAGFEIVYDCRDAGCGQGGRKTNGDWWDPNFQRRYLVGRLARPEGDLWACIHDQAKGPNVPGEHDVDLVEAKPEPRPEPVVRDETDAGWIETELNEHGHVALYRIGFDEKKHLPLTGSDLTLQAIAQLFSRDPRRKVLLVVHGNDLANWKADLQRSRKEAKGLIYTLVKKLGVPADRVAGDGVGPLVPMSPVAGAPPEATSRRVEIVSVEPPASSLRATGSTE
jgi:OOP family OmpA-OmpF porin